MGYLPSRLQNAMAVLALGLRPSQLTTIVGQSVVIYHSEIYLGGKIDK
jgi:hypothetical protein